MKKILAILCLVALLAAVIVPCTSFAGKKVRYRWVKVSSGTTVNVRSGPGKEYAVVGTLPYGTKVQIYEETNGFTLCEPIDSHYFWSNPQYIQSTFLVKSDPGPKPNPTPVPDDEAWNNVVKAAKALKFPEEPIEAVVKTKKPGNPVHLRWFPDTDAPFSDIIYAGEEITVLAQSKTWAQVKLASNDHVGFILYSCVDAEEVE